MNGYFHMGPLLRRALTPHSWG